MATIAPPLVRGRTAAAMVSIWVRLTSPPEVRYRTSPRVMSTQRSPPQAGDQHGPSPCSVIGSVTCSGVVCIRLTVGRGDEGRHPARGGASRRTLTREHPNRWSNRRPDVPTLPFLAG